MYKHGLNAIGPMLPFYGDMMYTTRHFELGVFFWIACFAASIDFKGKVDIHNSAIRLKNPSRFTFLAIFYIFSEWSRTVIYQNQPLEQNTKMAYTSFRRKTAVTGL